MKPRLKVLPLTREDYDILYHGYPWSEGNIATGREFFWGMLAGRSNESDRRDADLMFEAQDFPSRSVVYVQRHGKNVTWSERIDVRNGVDWP